MAVDEDGSYQDLRASQSPVSLHSRPKRARKRTARYESTPSSGEDADSPQRRRSTSSSAASLAPPLTPPSGSATIPRVIVAEDGHFAGAITADPESYDDSARYGHVAHKKRLSVPAKEKGACARGASKQTEQKQAVRPGRCAKTNGPPRDVVSRWVRAFSLQPKHEQATRLILDILLQDASFAFLDDHLRTASAFSLALFLFRFHPGPLVFTKRTGASSLDVEWARRMLLVYELAFKSILVDAGLLQDDAGQVARASSGHEEGRDRAGHLESAM